MTNDLQNLRREYCKLTNAPLDGHWSAETLAKKIVALKERKTQIEEAARTAQEKINARQAELDGRVYG